MSSTIACIVADWGTTNLRVWAMAADGRTIDRRLSDRGLLAVERGRFAETLEAACGDWLAGRRLPVVMSGMVGSKLGWKEVAYLATPLALDELARHLSLVEAPFAAAIVPGARFDDPAAPDVMRGEETQILGALQALGCDDGVFLLPGTHSKWAIVEDRQLMAFRTYMTGEIYGLLRSHGTLGQLMEAEAAHHTAFPRGVKHAVEGESDDLLHGLFGVRALGLLGHLPRPDLAGYLSGLLIGTEMRSGLAWLDAKGRSRRAVAVGSPGMLESYRTAAGLCGLELATLNSDDVTPGALLTIARSAGLLARAKQEPRPR